MPSGCRPCPVRSARACVEPRRAAKYGKSFRQSYRFAQLRAEFARAIGMNEIVALRADDIDLLRPAVPTSLTRSNAGRMSTLTTTIPKGLPFGS